MFTPEYVKRAELDCPPLSYLEMDVCSCNAFNEGRCSCMGRTYLDKLNTKHSFKGHMRALEFFDYKLSYYL